jgi:hypothetical protein
MKIDEVDFNVNAVEKMTEKEFIDTHFSTVKTDLSTDLREKWLVVAYGKITGKNKKLVKESDTK